MSNHTYPPQDHPYHYQPFAHTSPYPPPYYHTSPYFSPYYPQHPRPNCFTQALYPHSALPPTTYPPNQELSMNYSALPFDQGSCVSTFPSWHPQPLVQQEGTVEHAPLLGYSRPTETVQPCAIQGAPAITNWQVLDSAFDMECQQLQGAHATSNATDCLAEKEQQPHHGIVTQSISDMRDHIQAQLKTMSENLSQNLKRMNESKKSVATQAAGVAPLCFSKTKAPVTGSSSAEASAQFTSPASLFSNTSVAPSSSVSYLSSTFGSSFVVPTPMLTSVSATSASIYPLERAVPEPVFDVYADDTEGCSSKSVDVFVGTPGQQIYEDQQECEKLAKLFHKESENAFSEQLLRDFSKAPETEQTSADMLDYTFEQQQQNAKKSSANVQQLRDPQLNALVIHVRRKEWDPGASLPLMLDLAAWQNQSGGSGTCYIWDPGTVRDTLYAKHNCQTVQKNYNANNLLSSQKYLQILEMSIIFLTFLPP